MYRKTRTIHLCSVRPTFRIKNGEERTYRNSFSILTTVGVKQSYGLPLFLRMKESNPTSPSIYHLRLVTVCHPRIIYDKGVRH